MDDVEVEVDGQLYKSHVISIGSPTGTSTQPRGDDLTLDTPDDAIKPPESIEQFAQLSTLSSTRKSCIDAIVTNVVGLGYELVREEGTENAGEQSDPTEEISRARAELEALARRDTRLNQPSLTELLSAVKQDEEECGWGFIEVSRNRADGKPDGLFALPARRMRRLKDRSGYLLLPPSGDENDATYFADYGTKVAYVDGKPTADLADQHRGGWNRNEVICFKLYSSGSRDYGEPRDASLALEYLGDKLANESNAAFFSNGGALPTVLFVQGQEKQGDRTIEVEVPVEVTQNIGAVLQGRGSGPNGTGRVAIIPLPNGVKAQKETLGAVDNKDMGFVSFRGDVRQRCLSAFRLQPIFIGVATEGQYDAEVQRAITKEQVFNGQQTRYENRLTDTILHDLGHDKLKVALNDLAVEDDQAKRTSADSMAEVGTIIRSEHRKAHGYPPIPEAASSTTEIEWHGGTYKSAEPAPGQVPYGWNSEPINVGRPDGAENRNPDGTPGQKPGIGARASGDRGQAASELQTARLAPRAARQTTGAARRSAEKARALPEAQ